jgi:molybdopterin synthase sulfur carrier subunit
MIVRVNLYATFRTAFGQKRVELTLPEEATVATVLHHLSVARPGFRAELLTEQGELLNHVTIFLSGTDVRSLQGLTTPVSEGVVLDLFPPVAGGACFGLHHH